MIRRNELHIPSRKIKNTTQQLISVYTNTGEIITFEPNQKVADSDFYYIVDENILGKKCLRVQSKSKGRGGVSVCSLVLYSNPKIRVYPTVGK